PRYRSHRHARGCSCGARGGRSGSRRQTSDTPTTATRAETNRSLPWEEMDVASQTSERELLGAAVKGNEDAFRRLVEPRQSELRRTCYRMLCSCPPHRGWRPG